MGHSDERFPTSRTTVWVSCSLVTVSLLLLGAMMSFNLRGRRPLTSKHPLSERHSEQSAHFASVPYNVLPPLAPTTSTHSPMPTTTETETVSDDPSVEVCNALKKWLKSDCANDPNTLTTDFTLQMANGSFHSLTAFFRRLYPEVNDTSFEAAKERHRNEWSANESIEGNEKNVVRAIRELDTGHLLDSFAHFFKTKKERPYGWRWLCDWKFPQTVYTATHYIWLPDSCTVPFSARLKQIGFPLVPRNWNIVVIGNSYNSQVSNSLFQRTVHRGEAKVTDAFPRNCRRNICSYKYSFTGVQHLEVVNVLYCMSPDKLVKKLVAEMKVSNVNDIVLILINDGNSVTSRNGTIKTGCKLFGERGLPKKYDSEGVLALLRELNYSGLALRSNDRYGPTRKVFAFDYAHALNLSTVCTIERHESCAAAFGHECTPGHPDWASEALSTNAYLHFCRNKFGNKWP